MTTSNAGQNASFATVSPGTPTELLFMSSALTKIKTLDDTAPPVFMWMALHGAHDDTYNGTSNVSLSWLNNYQTDYTYFEEVVDTLNVDHMREQFIKTMLGIDEVVNQMKLSFDELSQNSNRDFLLIVNSDNGGFPCGSYLVGSPFPHRGSKFNYFEGGVKVPAFIYSSSTAVIADSAVGTEYAGLMHHV